MSDKIMAILALAAMIAFLGVGVWLVPEIDLFVIIALVALLASFGFWQPLHSRGQRGD